jgi:hypothetical protein
MFHHLSEDFYTQDLELFHGTRTPCKESSPLSLTPPHTLLPVPTDTGAGVTDHLLPPTWIMICRNVYIVFMGIYLIRMVRSVETKRMRGTKNWNT